MQPALSAIARHPAVPLLFAALLALPSGTWAAGAGAGAGAEEQADGLTTVVTGSRTQERLEDSAVAVEVVTRRELETSGARTLAEALSTQPGIEVRHGFAGAELWLGGLAPAYTLVLVDGERVAGRLAGSFDLSRIPVEEIEQIEVLRGPSTVLYGSDAVGGVVNVVTRRAHRPLAGEVRLSGGSLRQGELHAAGAVRRESFRARLSGRLHRRDPFDLSPEDPATTGSGIAGFGVWARADGALSQSVRLEGSAEAERVLLRGVELGAGGAIFDRVRQGVGLAAQARVITTTEAVGSLSLSARVSQFEHQSLLDQRRATVLDKLEVARERQLRFALQWEPRLPEGHRAVVGAEWLAEALSSDRLEQDGRRGRGSFFAEDTWIVPFFEAVPMQLVGGVRGDLDSSFGPSVTPRLALRVDPHPTLTVRTSYGWAFRAPSFTEQLIDFENPSVGYVVAGNPLLRPERARGGLLNAEWRPAEKTLAWVGLFRSDLTDMITVTSALQPDGLRLSYDNIARATVQGVELGLRQRLPFGLGLGLGYTFTHGRDLDTGRAPEGQSPHRATARLDFRHRPTRLELSAQAQLQGRRPFYGDSGLGTDHVAPPHVTLDGRIAHALTPSIRLFLAGQNLTGTGDALYLPLPPRSLFAGIAAQL